MATEHGQRLEKQGFQQLPNLYMHSAEKMAQMYQQHGMTAIIPTEMPAPDAAYLVGQACILPMSPRDSHAKPLYSSLYDSVETRLVYQQQQHQRSRKRKNLHDDLVNDCPETHQIGAPAPVNDVREPIEMSLHSHEGPMRSQACIHNSDLSPTNSASGDPNMPTQAHHHHRMPEHPLPSIVYRTGYDHDLYTAEIHGLRSVVGQPGIPEPAPKPEGPKLKFTPADDDLLVKLKETKNLTWKRIASFFPGRSSSTLQVRYCTKLKAKKMIWTQDVLDRLHHAIEGYEHDRWCIISKKVGKGFSAAACKDKFKELNGQAIERKSRTMADSQLCHL